MTTNDKPRKRLMAPVVDQPYALVTGELTELKFYGPSSLNDEVRSDVERWLDEVADPWQLVPLHDLRELTGADVPVHPVEAKREQFLALAAEATRLLAEAGKLCDEANEHGAGNEEMELREEAATAAWAALALAEELLA